MDYALATHQNTLYLRQARQILVFLFLAVNMCLPKIPIPAQSPLLLIAKSHGIQVTSNNETDNNFYTPYIQPILSPGDYLRPTTTSFLQMANICRLLKCKNPISEAYNFGFSQLLFVGLCGPENDKKTQKLHLQENKKCSRTAAF
jgi:hypothetical protein